MSSRLAFLCKTTREGRFTFSKQRVQNNGN